MTLRGIAHVLDDAARRLAGFPNPALDAELLFRGVSGMSRAALLAEGGEPGSSLVATAFEAALVRREQHEPIQYILGTASFWRDEFAVSPAVLIPRPDTEVLVEAVAARLRQLPSSEVLDIGTGSGCIALSLLREMDGARAVAVDISQEALDVAELNARRLGFIPRIDLRLSHWLDAVGPSEAFDAIVSNPPYVARKDAPSLPREVREHEPSLALFAEEADDLSSYRAILAAIDAHLKPGGLLALEVGAGQAERVAFLLAASGLGSIETLRDLADIPRVVLARRR